MGQILVVVVPFDARAGKYKKKTQETINIDKVSLVLLFIGHSVYQN